MSLPDFDQAALELVSEFGGVGQYIKTIPGTYDPATGKVGSPTIVSQPITISIFDLTRPNNGLTTKVGTDIIAGDKEAYVIPPQKTGGFPLVIDPVNDTIQVGGITYNVLTSKEVNPSGTDPILYTIYLRR